MADTQMLNLIQRARTGDRDAFGVLAEQFQPMVFAIVLRKLGNRAEAHETTQDVLMQAFSRLWQLQNPERFAGWLRQIARRMAINRAVRRPEETLRAPETFDALRDEPETPVEVVLRAERREQVLDGIRRLRDMDRETLLAFYFEGKSLQEMSADFCRPVGTIKRRLHTARHRLREELSLREEVSARHPA